MGSKKITVDIDGKEGDIYFEINEDFNLNVKLESKNFKDYSKDNVKNNDNVIGLQEKIASLNLPEGIKRKKRFYKQQVFVLYEFDMGFLDNLYEIEKVSDNIFKVLKEVHRVL